eukprot:scaffold9153_cov121-Cylindrotheca_fusiformis.AAC.3
MWIDFDTFLHASNAVVPSFSSWLLSIRFVGEIGANELAAAALATTLCNVTGLSFSVGLSFALTTLAGQAKGELGSRTSQSDGEVSRRPLTQDEPLTTLVYLFRGLIIQLVLVIPIGIWWMLGTETALVTLGQDSEIAAMTDSYLRVLAPGLWAYAVSWTLTAWVQSIGMADVPAYAAVLGLVLHVPFNCCNRLLPDDTGYLFCSEHGRGRVLEASGGVSIGMSKLSWKKELILAVSSLEGLYQYMKLAVPGIVIISEWWASEFSIFLSGRLEPFPEAALGGMTIYQSINTFCFMFPVAFSVSASTRVGNLLGEGKPKLASFAGKVSVGCAASVSFVIGLILFVTPHEFLPSLFAPNEDEVILEASRTLPLLAIYVFADGVQSGESLFSYEDLIA